MIVDVGLSLLISAFPPSIFPSTENSPLLDCGDIALSYSGSVTQLCCLTLLPYRACCGVNTTSISQKSIKLAQG